MLKWFWTDERLMIGSALFWLAIAVLSYAMELDGWIIIGSLILVVISILLLVAGVVYNGQTIEIVEDDNGR